MKKTISALFAVLLCAALMLTGCSGTASQTDSGTTTTEHEPITIYDAQRDYSALIALVKEKYPEINIEVLPYRGRNMSAYMKLQLKTGIMPDIYSSTQAWDEEYQKAHLVDLSKYAVSELYSVARLEEYAVDGGNYLLPYDYSILGITYNKSLFDRLGIEVPTSFAQLRDETIPALDENGVNLSESLLDLPGSAFNYFFSVSATVFTNTTEGRKWRSEFTDVSSDTFASDNEGIAAAVDYFQQWIDVGMIKQNHERTDTSAPLNTFLEGNTAFFIGSNSRFSQNDDGTGDQFALMPFLSEDGTQNSYTTSPGRFYGLNIELEEEGNEQKLEDALHFLEVLSSQEGYDALIGANSTNMSSIRDFTVDESSPYYNATQLISNGHSQATVYTGWESYLVTFGESIYSWIIGEGTPEEALETLDNLKLEVREQGVTSYATVTEELDTVQAAQLCGQMFLKATGTDAALISYNVYSPEVHAIFENSYGANGHILPCELTDENITIFLPTGWYDTLTTFEATGAEIKMMAAEGADTRGKGFKYPYVFMTATGEELADDETYSVVICGIDKDLAETLATTDTGIVGLDAAKAYLQEVGTVSSATLDNSLVQSTTSAE